jgi:hypothetical protein
MSVWITLGPTKEALSEEGTTGKKIAMYMIAMTYWYYAVQVINAQIQ